MLKTAMGFRALVTFFILGSLAQASMTRAEEELREGFDKQSPAEIEQAHKRIERDFAHALLPHDRRINRRKTLDQYAYLDPNHDVPSDLLADAVVFFDANKDSFPNQNYISIVDFKPRSDHYRLYLVDMASGAVEKYHTTHGVGSDVNKDGIAETFGNVPDSGKSSLGFVRTAEVYDGKFKRSLRLDGLSTTNSNIRDRAVIFHGWDDVHEANVIQGLSWGCITMDWKLKDAAIDKIKEGSLMYVGVSKL